MSEASFKVPGGTYLLMSQDDAIRARPLKVRDAVVKGRRGGAAHVNSGSLRIKRRQQLNVGGWGRMDK